MDDNFPDKNISSKLPLDDIGTTRSDTTSVQRRSDTTPLQRRSQLQESSKIYWILLPDVSQRQQFDKVLQKPLKPLPHESHQQFDKVLQKPFKLSPHESHRQYDKVPQKPFRPLPLQRKFLDHPFHSHNYLYPPPEPVDYTFRRSDTSHYPQRKYLDYPFVRPELSQYPVFPPIIPPNFTPPHSIRPPFVRPESEG